jgi:hypothetical protein
MFVIQFTWSPHPWCLKVLLHPLGHYAVQCWVSTVRVTWTQLLQEFTKWWCVLLVVWRHGVVLYCHNSVVWLALVVLTSRVVIVAILVLLLVIATTLVVVTLALIMEASYDTTSRNTKSVVTNYLLGGILNNQDATSKISKWVVELRVVSLDCKPRMAIKS